jgi:hypothetical protein
MCYNLAIGEKDLTHLALVGLASYLREKLEGHEFTGMNQVLQMVVVSENRAKDKGVWPIRKQR